MLRKKVLIMDDEEDLCKEVCEYLVDLGYNAIYANNGHQGLLMLDKEVPDLLILDIRMPKVDGLQVMQEIIAKYPNLIVVVLSGVLDSETTARIIEYGAAECIPKPVRLEELHEKVIKRFLGDGLPSA